MFGTVERRRNFGRVLRAIADPRQRTAAREAFRTIPKPIDLLMRYAGSGSYPAAITIRTPTGEIAPTIYSWHDARTIHEIFLAGDYQIGTAPKVVVDFGSNIGISAAYFLSRNPENRIYLFEPVPQNIERLRSNMEPFATRFFLEEIAVGVETGKVSFGVEDNGRYGGIGLATGKSIMVDCVDANKVLQDIIAKHGRIEVLKVDVETLEHAIIKRITHDLASHIDLLLVEARFKGNPLSDTHTMIVHGTISRFEIKA